MGFFDSPIGIQNQRGFRRRRRGLWGFVRLWLGLIESGGGLVVNGGLVCDDDDDGGVFWFGV